jgi:hypothetical protein
MSTHHATAGEVVDIATWAEDLPAEHSKAIVKTAGLELARLVIKSGVAMHGAGYCRVDGPVVMHCIEGEVELDTPDFTVRLCAGQLVYLNGRTDHALTGVQDSVVLLTIVLPG